MDTTPLLDLHNIRRAFPRPGGSELLVLDDVNLTVKQGEIVGLLGRSGSGKSTLLRIIAGLISPSEGRVLYRGRPVDGPQAGIAMVFQTFALFPWLTVLENVEAGLEAQGMARAERRARALAAIDLIGLDGFENAYPRELSGGMRQRVGFARALVVNPDLLLMDEPFSALDVLTAETLRTDLLELWREKRLETKSILIVTHNIEEAVFMCDRILILSSNPGRVVAEVPVAFPHPRNRLDPAFRRLVDSIYEKMTSRRGAAAAQKRLEFGSWLPEVSTNIMAGLVEAIAAPPYNGHADLPVLAEKMHLEVDELFLVAEILEQLRFVDVREGDIMLTQAGKLFSDYDTQQRKTLFAAHLLRNVPLAAHIRKVLAERRDQRAPRARFEQELEDHLNDGAADQALNTVIDWGRYAEIFSYNDQTETFSLEDVEGSH